MAQRQIGQARRLVEDISGQPMTTARTAFKMKESKTSICALRRSKLTHPFAKHSQLPLLHARALFPIATVSLSNVKLHQIVDIAITTC